MINLCDVKDFDDLDSNISATRHADKLILLDDFNVNAGQDH